MDDKVPFTEDLYWEEKIEPDDVKKFTKGGLQIFTNLLQTVLNDTKTKSIVDENAHLEHIGGLVKSICEKLQVVHPIFDEIKVLGRVDVFCDLAASKGGDGCRDTSILQLDEVGYLLPLNNLLKNIKIIQKFSSDSIECLIEIKDNASKEFIQKASRDLKRRLVSADKTYLTTEIREALHQAVHECLKYVDGITYKGKGELGPKRSAWESISKLIPGPLNKGDPKLLECILDGYKEQFKDKQLIEAFENNNYNPNLGENEVVLDVNTHGPCVRIRIGGKLCTVDVDLGFCLSDSQSETPDGRYVALPFEKNTVPDLKAWTVSRYYNTAILTPRHMLILKFLKHILFEIQLVPDVSVHDSQALVALVRKHQKTCKQKKELRQEGGKVTVDNSTAACLLDVLFRVFEGPKVKFDGSVKIKKAEYSLEDDDFKSRPITEKPDNLDFLAFLYRMVFGILKSNDSYPHREFLSRDRWHFIGEIRSDFE